MYYVTDRASASHRECGEAGLPLTPHHNTMASPTGRLSGKRCLVTAAAQGIGRATVEAFLREGAALVVAVDINVEKLNELPSDRVVRRVLDVRDGEGIKALARDYPDIDVLFNCVGIVHQSPLLETADQEWDNSFDVNVKSMFLFCREFLPKMISLGGGSIINMASVASSLRAINCRCVYGATKAAIIGLTKGLAMEHVQDGIRCNVVCPSPIASPNNRLEHIIFMGNKRIGRLAKAEEVANLCLFLASNEEGRVLQHIREKNEKLIKLLRSAKRREVNEHFCCSCSLPGIVRNILYKYRDDELFPLLFLVHKYFPIKL